MTRYHKALYFPPTIRPDLVEFVANLPVLRLSKHAEQQVAEEENRNRPITPPTTLNPSTCFEVYIETGRIEKAVFRVKTNAQYDTIYVVSRLGIVITLWSNSRDDNHQTLNPNLYERQST